MLKKALVVVAVVAAPLFTTSVSSAQVAPVYDYFCHRSNSAQNPYQVKPFSKTYAEIDGQGNNDHTQHTGDVFDPAVHNQQNRTWGDIIPPVPGVLPAGMNWTAEGQEIWENGCNIEGEEPQPIITWAVSCTVRDETDYVQVSLTNDGDADGTVTLNGDDVVVPAASSTTRNFADGTRVTLVVDQQTVYDQVVNCADDPEEEGVVLGSQSNDAEVVATMPETGASTAVAIAASAVAGMTLLLGMSKALLSKFSR